MKHLYTFLLFCCASFLVAQSYVGDKLLAKPDYAKAWAKINKSLTKCPDDASALYGAYVYYLAGDNAQRDTVKAYDCISHALRAHTAADAKTQGKLDKAGLSPMLLQSAAESVCEAQLVKALGLNTIGDLEGFLNYYTLSTTDQQQRATSRIHELAYAQAERQNTTKAYRSFISSYPLAVQVPLAWSHIYDLEWLATKERGTKADYEDYIRSYPTSPHRAEAQEMIDQYDYLQATRDHSWEQYADYIRKNARQNLKTIPMARQELYGITHKSGSVKLLEKTLQGDYLISPLRDSLLLQLHDIYVNARLLNATDFHQRYTDACLADLKRKDEAAIEAYDQMDAYDSNSIAEFIHQAAPYRVAYYQLQRLIASSLNDKNYDEALRTAQQFADDFGDDRDYRMLLKTLSAPLEGIEKKAFPVAINAVGYEQYSPVMTADDRTLYFCQKNYSEDIYVSTLQNGQWKKAKYISELCDDYNQEAPEAISVDGTKLLFFRNGTICEVNKSATGWEDYTPMPSTVNVCDWQADVQITADGKALLMTAWMPGDYEPSDVTDFYGDSRYRQCNIFVCLKDDEGHWTSPIDLGPTINTPWCDRSPYLHPDGRTLYFTSNGHGSLGSHDVFVSTRLSEDSWTEWSEPINLGKEINTTSQDWGYKISTDGTTGYFSSNNDIMYCHIPRHLRPNMVATISGRLLDKDGKPISATIRWEDLEDHKEVGQSHSDPTDGSYYMVLPLGKMYGYYVEDDTHFPISNSLDLREEEKAVRVEQNLETVSLQQMIDEGVAVPMNNLFFDYSKYDLRPTSLSELERAAEIIKKTKLRVEISGHTDNAGSDQLNQTLSENRAAAVRDYLITLGCNPDLLTAVGYGESRPVVPNTTEANRQKNRRVELRFVK